MKYAIGILILTILLVSCSGKSSLKSDISQLEEILDKTEMPTDSLLEPLLLAYTSYIRKFPDDKLSPVYLYKVGSIYVRMQNWKEAAKHFEFVIDRYPDSDICPEAILLAAYSYETIRGNNEERATTLYKMYLEKYPKGPGKERAEFYFQPEDAKMRFRIADYQKELYKNKGLNRQTAHQLVRQYLSYIKNYPQSEFTPNYCFEGGKLASTIGESLDACEFLLTIIENYPDYRQYPETLLLLAVEYETKMPVYSANNSKSNKQYQKMKRFDLSKTDWLKESEKLYRTFLNKYPRHDLAEQATASLKHLGKTPNEVVSEFKKNLEERTEIKKK